MLVCLYRWFNKRKNTAEIIKGRAVSDILSDSQLLNLWRGLCTFHWCLDYYWSVSLFHVIGRNTGPQFSLHGSPKL